MLWSPILVVSAAATVLVSAASAQPLSAVTSLVGRPIVGVTLEAEGRPATEPDVLDLIETRVGETLVMADVRESVFHLASVGRFDEVEVDGRADGEGVALTYRLVPARRVTQIEFRGGLGVSARRLRPVLGSRALGTPTAERMRDAEQALASFYASQGYFAATIGSRVDDVPNPTRSSLVFSIEAGPRSRVGELEVSARGQLARVEVLARLGLETGDEWDAPRLEERAERFVEDLRGDGFYEASITWQVRRDDGRRLVDLTIEADSGPRVELVFESGTIPAERLRPFVSVEREGSIDEDLLEDSKRRIERWVHAQGHWRASVDYERTEEDGRLRITFRVTPRELYEVDRIGIEGVEASRETDVRALLHLKPAAPFVEETLETDAAAVEEYYRRRGFGAVQVRSVVADVPGRAAPAGKRLVEPRLVVEEGKRTAIGRVVLNGVSAVPEEELRRVMVLAPGGAFFAPQLVADRTAVQAYYLARGFRDVSVDTIPRASDVSEVVDLVYEITEGSQYTVGHVLVAGNARTSDSTILRELMLEPGTVLGASDLAEGQRRLSALGLFRRVRVEGLARPGRQATDILVTVEEAPVTTIGYGVGLEGGRRLVSDPAQGGQAVEKLEISPRGFFEIGRRNLWGKNRSVNLFTRFSLRDRGGSETATTEDDSSFYEFRVVGTYREPRAFGTVADAQVSGFVEQGVRSSFNFGRRGVNAELARRVTPSVTVVGRYGFGHTKLFDQRFNPDEEPIIDRLFPQVRLSIFSGVLVQDTRDDPLDPTRGHVLNLQGDVSGRAVGSEVGFVKSFAQAFLYRRLPGSERVVFAGGARLGLARAFGAEVVLDDTGESVVVDIEDLPASERYYAGGSTTVRGYALDRLGDDETIDSSGFPQGGNALIIFNAELRFPIWRALGGVAFVDAGNVFAQVGDFDFGRIKAAAGTGLRYKSPIGPVRVDVGFKFDPRTFATGNVERRWEVHVSLGQAF